MSHVKHQKQINFFLLNNDYKFLNHIMSHNQNSVNKHNQNYIICGIINCTYGYILFMYSTSMQIN